MLNKIKNWLLILFSSFLLLTGTLTTVSIFFNQVPEFATSGIEKTTTLFGGFIFIFISILGIRKGINNLKKIKKPADTSYSKYLYIELNGKINEIKEGSNFKINSNNKYRNLINISLGVTIFIIQLKKEQISDSLNPYYLMLIILFAGIILQLVLTSLQRKKLSKNITRKNIRYTIGNEFILIKDELTESKLSWNDFNSMTESKDFFIFYQDKNTFTIINKAMFNYQDLSEFNKFIKSLNLKTNNFLKMFNI